MRFLLDESADYPLAAFLQQYGHNVTAIVHDYPHALSDLQVLAIAYQEQRILLTNDRDFGELLFRRRLPHAGVILFRLGEEDLQTKQAWLLYILRHHAQDLHDFIIVTPHKIRVRRAF